MDVLHVALVWTSWATQLVTNHFFASATYLQSGNDHADLIGWCGDYMKRCTWGIYYARNGSAILLSIIHLAFHKDFD